MVNKFFVLSFENDTDRTVHKKYYFPTVEGKYYNVMTDGLNVFDQPVQDDLRTYEDVRKIVTYQRGDYATDCLLGYNYFKDYYKMITIYLSKKQGLNTDSKGTQQINFRGNLSQNPTFFFIIEKA